MVEGVAVVTGDERILYCNWAFEQILELPEGSSQGRTLVEALRQADLVALVRQALSGEEELTGEVEVGTVRRRNFSVTAAPVRAAGANGAVLVLHDITELRRLERVRRDFVANVSHEFKTPLTAIQGFAETLLSGALDDKANRNRFVEIIRDHARRLARLTDDLLKLSRIEAGRLELEIRPIRVEALVNGCVETARLNAKARGLEIHVDLQENAPAVRGDGAQLGEVLQNLLDNALQYTPSGGQIEVTARVERDVASSSRLPTQASEFRNPTWNAFSNDFTASMPRDRARRAAPALASRSPAISWRPTAAASGWKAPSARVPASISAFPAFPSGARCSLFLLTQRRAPASRTKCVRTFL